uniref:ABC transporter substrate-binding protein n=1 Tax=Caldivirga sp. UBA161 TaxID=1915569 RepID=UPI0025C3856D
MSRPIIPYVLASIAAAILVTVILGGHVAYAASTPQIIVAAPTTIIYTPGTPVYNPYAPSNLVGTVMTYLPLALYNPFTGQFYPVLAENWSAEVLPNGSALFTIYLRPNIYWFNGSATMPFTAWDVYAYFYIGIKAFDWYTPWINLTYVDSDIRVINDTTIQFLFQKWTPMIPYWMLPSWISTPYPVWKPIVDKLKTMNATQAAKYSTNITEFVAPYWGLNPYYLSYISTTYFDYTLEPMYYNGVPLLATWEEIFPVNSWFIYNPTTIDWYVGGNTQAMSAFLAGKANWGFVGLSLSQVSVLNKSGTVGVYLSPDFSAFGITINPWYGWPFNNPIFREALCYVINRSAVVAAWGLNYPDYYPAPVLSYTANLYPPSFSDVLVPCSYDPSKAAQMLQSIGLRKVNGYWSFPNGTPITIYVYGPSGWTDWMTMASEAVEQLQAFGFKASLIAQDVGVYWGTTIPQSQYQAAVTWKTYVKSLDSAWTFLNWPWWVFGTAIQAYTNHSVFPFQWPNGTCTPVTAPASLNLPNSTVVWCVNSTFGYINITNWQMFFGAGAPGSEPYDLAVKTLFAWYDYYVPVIPLGEKIEPLEYAKNLIDPMWLYKCLPFYTIETLVYENDLSGMPYGWPNTVQAGLFFGAWAPPGEVPPLAQVIANGSLWTKYPQFAAFIGIPNPDTSLQQCVASYFHIPYTP